MAVVLNALKNPNKMEYFEREDRSYAWVERNPDAYSAAEKLLDETDFNALDQTKCQEFMRAHGKDLLKLQVGSSVGKLGFLLKVLDDVLIEEGLFAGGLRRVPCVHAKSVLETQSTPYSVVRVIYRKDRKDWQILARMEDETILLRKFQHGGEWLVSMPWKRNPQDHAQLSARLSHSYERFLRFSMKFERHFKIERVAIDTFSAIGLSKNVYELALQYVGYPTEAEKQQAEAGREKLEAEAEFGEPIALARPQEEDAPAAQPAGKLDRLKNWAASWF